MTAVDEVVTDARRLASSSAPLADRLVELRRHRPRRLDTAYVRCRRGDADADAARAADLLEAVIALRSSLALQPPAWWQRLEWLLVPIVAVVAAIVAAQVALRARVRPEVLLLLALPLLHVMLARRLGSLEVPAVPGHPGRLASLAGELDVLTSDLAAAEVDEQTAGIRVSTRAWGSGDELATLVGALAVAQAEKSAAIGAVSRRSYRLDVLGRSRRLLCSRLPDGLVAR